MEVNYTVPEDPGIEPAVTLRLGNDPSYTMLTPAQTEWLISALTRKLSEALAKAHERDIDRTGRA